MGTGPGAGREGWDDSGLPPLDVKIPDDARELARDVLAYHREQRAQRRRSRLRRLLGLGSPGGGRASVMPLIASVLAVCLVAGAMLSVFTISPTSEPSGKTHQPNLSTAGPATSGRSSPQQLQTPKGAKTTKAAAPGTARPAIDASTAGAGTTASAGSAGPANTASTSSFPGPSAPGAARQATTVPIGQGAATPVKSAP